MPLIVFASIMITFAIILAPSIWVYNDAQKYGMNAWGWALATFFFSGFIGLVIYLIVRHQARDHNAYGNYNMYNDYSRPQRQQPATVRCPHCGEIVDAAYPHCPRCGEQLKGECPHCHLPIEPTWNRCAHCGEPIPDYAKRP